MWVFEMLNQFNLLQSKYPIAVLYSNGGDKHALLLEHKETQLLLYGPPNCC